MKRTTLLSLFISISFATVLAQQASPAAVHPESGTWMNIGIHDTNAGQAERENGGGRRTSRQEAAIKFLDSFALSGEVGK